MQRSLRYTRLMSQEWVKTLDPKFPRIQLDSFFHQTFPASVPIPPKAPVPFEHRLPSYENIKYELHQHLHHLLMFFQLMGFDLHNCCF